MSNKIDLLLADSHDLVRAGFRALIEADSRFKVVSEAGDGLTCLEQVRAKEPDIVILELALPKLTGMNVISQLKRRHKDIKIFVLTSAETPSVWQEVLDMEVLGLANKSIGIDELLNGLEDVSKGKRFIQSSIASKVIVADSLEDDMPKKRILRRLSVREKQVTKLIAEGFKTKDIAVMLEISDRTVSKHRENLMTKLGATSPAEITHYATDTGLTKVKILEIE